MMEEKATKLSLEELLRTSPSPEWLVRMQEHYARTGAYRPEDLFHLLGDPTRRVEAGPTPSLASFVGR